MDIVGLDLTKLTVIDLIIYWPHTPHAKVAEVEAGRQQHTRRVKDMQGRLETAESNSSSLAAELDGKDKQLNVLEAAADTLRRELKQRQLEVERVQHEHTLATDKVRALEGTVHALNNTVNSNKFK